MEGSPIWVLSYCNGLFTQIYLVISTCIEILIHELILILQNFETWYISEISHIHLMYEWALYLHEWTHVVTYRHFQI